MKIRELFENHEVSVINKMINGGVKFTKKMSESTEQWEADFNCANLKLTTLVGVPKNCKFAFACQTNRLTTLEGGPETVGHSFYCFDNNLTSLIGCPKSVGGHFSCSNNNIKSLDGIQERIFGSLDCARNDLKTLQGGPKEIDGTLQCSFNDLSTFDGFPLIIGNNLFLSENKFTSLKNIHKYIKKIGGTIFLTNNPIKSHILGLLLIENLSNIQFSSDPDLENIINKYLPNSRGRTAVYDCQEELIQAGFEEYAQL